MDVYSKDFGTWIEEICAQVTKYFT